MFKEIVQNSQELPTMLKSFMEEFKDIAPKELPSDENHRVKQILSGPITKFRRAQLEEALNGLIQEVRA